MMKTVKKEATSIKNLVTMTVDTTISICTDFVCAEKLIKRELKKRYKVYVSLVLQKTKNVKALAHAYLVY